MANNRLKLKNSEIIHQDYKVHRNGEIYRSGKILRDNNLNITIGNKDYMIVINRSETVYNAFIGRKKTGWLIKRIDRNKPSAVHNLVSYPRNKGFSHLLLYSKPALLKLIFIVENSDINTQIDKLHEETKELAEAIEEMNVEHIVEELADVVIAGLTVMLTIGLNKFIDAFMFKLNRTVDRFKAGYYKKEEK